MPQESERFLKEKGVTIWRLPAVKGRLDLHQLLARLTEEGLDSVLIEGGGETAASFLNAGLVDKVSMFIAPLFIGGIGAVPSVGGNGIEHISDAIHLHRVSTEWLGDDLLYEGYTKELLTQRRTLASCTNGCNFNHR
jgi:diaminohydroxyphosphoribosylaminopyrimidine deaminase/5-amino-6-(5-phosphoribosylamino)uracil reductase